MENTQLHDRTANHSFSNITLHADILKEIYSQHWEEDENLSDVEIISSTSDSESDDGNLTSRTSSKVTSQSSQDDGKPPSLVKYRPSDALNLVIKIEPISTPEMFSRPLEGNNSDDGWTSDGSGPSVNTPLWQKILSTPHKDLTDSTEVSTHTSLSDDFSVLSDSGQEKNISSDYKDQNEQHKAVQQPVASGSSASHEGSQSSHSYLLNSEQTNLLKCTTIKAEPDSTQEYSHTFSSQAPVNGKADKLDKQVDVCEAASNALTRIEHDYADAADDSILLSVISEKPAERDVMNVKNRPCMSPVHETDITPKTEGHSLNRTYIIPPKDSLLGTRSDGRRKTHSIDYNHNLKGLSNEQCMNKIANTSTKTEEKQQGEESFMNKMLSQNPAESLSARLQVFQEKHEKQVTGTTCKNPDPHCQKLHAKKCMRRDRQRLTSRCGTHRVTTGIPQGMTYKEWVLKMLSPESKDLKNGHLYSTPPPQLAPRVHLEDIRQRSLPSKLMNGSGSNSLKVLSPFTIHDRNLCLAMAHSSVTKGNCAIEVVEKRSTSSNQVTGCTFNEKENISSSCGRFTKKNKTVPPKAQRKLKMESNIPKNDAVFKDKQALEKFTISKQGVSTNACTNSISPTEANKSRDSQQLDNARKEILPESDVKHTYPKSKVSVVLGQAEEAKWSSVNLTENRKLFPKSPTCAGLATAANNKTDNVKEVQSSRKLPTSTRIFSNNLLVSEDVKNTTSNSSDESDLTSDRESDISEFNDGYAADLDTKIKSESLGEWIAKQKQKVQVKHFVKLPFDKEEKEMVESESKSNSKQNSETIASKEPDVIVKEKVSVTSPLMLRKPCDPELHNFAASDSLQETKHDLKRDVNSQEQENAKVCKELILNKKTCNKSVNQSETYVNSCNKNLFETVVDVCKSDASSQKTSHLPCQDAFKAPCWKYPLRVSALDNKMNNHDTAKLPFTSPPQRKKTSVPCQVTSTPSRESGADHKLLDISMVSAIEPLGENLHYVESEDIPNEENMLCLSPHVNKHDETLTKSNSSETKTEQQAVPSSNLKISSETDGDGSSHTANIFVKQSTLHAHTPTIQVADTCDMTKYTQDPFAVYDLTSSGEDAEKTLTNSPIKKKATPKRIKMFHSKLCLSAPSGNKHKSHVTLTDKRNELKTGTDYSTQPRGPYKMFKSKNELFGKSETCLTPKSHYTKCVFSPLSGKTTPPSKARLKYSPQNIRRGQSKSSVENEMPRRDCDSEKKESISDKLHQKPERIGESPQSCLTNGIISKRKRSSSHSLNTPTKKAKLLKVDVYLSGSDDESYDMSAESSSMMTFRCLGPGKCTKVFCFSCGGKE